MNQAKWETRIREAWRDAVPAGRRVVRDGFDLNPAPGTFYDCDPIDAQNLLAGKRWDEIDDDNDPCDRFGIEQPFFYLTPEASAYYLGGYLLHVCQDWHLGLADLPTIHVVCFLGSERFDAAITYLSENQKQLVSLFALAISMERGVFGFSDEDVAGLERAARKIDAT
jgi:hypothetical protein